ncbi:SDR family NAD(P)-dependent oxidoreductase [Rhodococcus sp. ARC_M6]|uniref:SDR family NAD(P)-dependent oxidoreductase n=1 Tax=Rhodococcus sp. ARC_M6 TaxID=2928852 RepID=UPI001FB4B02A|nr:SDR family NAD(P)-dependent oxidoreductase [Rhodococcus sp. ARC_M6]MCJ0903309.1 SDR family oxidoreductase [Rhodococcus sp. ARC_M6]
MNSVSGRSALVTGGAHGIGTAIAKSLSEAGIGVLIGDLLDSDCEEQAAKLGSRVAFQHLDITQTESWESALETAEETFGPLIALVNNARLLEFGSIQEQHPTSFRHVLNTNLYGAWLGMHCAAGALIKSGDGVIVNISSTAGLTGYANIGAYCASQWGLRGLTKAAALDLGPHNIRVCSVHPGQIDSEMTPGFGSVPVTQQPIPRIGRPEEVAAMVRFIVCEATYSTGTEFIVDGGCTAGVPPPIPDEE